MVRRTNVSGGKRSPSKKIKMIAEPIALRTKVKGKTKGAWIIPGFALVTLHVESLS